MAPGSSKDGEFKKAATAQIAESVMAAIATVTSFAVGAFAPNGIIRLTTMRISTAAFMTTLSCIICYGYKENNHRREKRQSGANVVQSGHELPSETNNHLLV